MSYIDRHLLSGERVTFRAKRHWITFATPLFLALIGILGILGGIVTMISGGEGAAGSLFVGILLIVLPLGLTYLDYISSEFAVTNKRVIGKVGFLGRNSLEILLTKVEAINVEQGIVGRLFNYGTITIGGTGASKNLFTSIADPLAVRRHVQEQVDRFGDSSQYRRSKA